MRCEVCRDKAASHICRKCHRLVCEDCYSASHDACLDCAQVISSQETWYRLTLDRITTLDRAFEEALRRETCRDCPVLRDSLLRTLADLKRIGAMARVDGFEDIEREVREVYRRVERKAMTYLARLMMRLKRP